jgi:F0F1-type ATP synthase membrane subunit b/b'
MFLSLDGTFFFQLINFAIFFAILNVVFLRPVGAAIKKRRAHIDEVQSDYEKYSKVVNASRTDAEARRNAARREADETIAKARAAAENEAQLALEGQTAQAHAIIEQARATVALETGAAREREDELSHALAKTLLERALGGTRS